MDGVVSPRTAIEIGRLGGLACLNLEGLWTRYEDPEPYFEEIAALEPEKATRRMQEIYAEPLKDELIGRRIAEIRDAGVTACASLTPQRVEYYAKAILEAELDLLVVQGTVVSAEHVSKDDSRQPLNLKKFIREYEIPVIVGGLPRPRGAAPSRRHRRRHFSGRRDRARAQIGRHRCQRMGRALARHGHGPA